MYVPHFYSTVYTVKTNFFKLFEPNSLHHRFKFFKKVIENLKSNFFLGDRLSTSYKDARLSTSYKGARLSTSYKDARLSTSYTYTPQSNIMVKRGICLLL